MVMVMRDIKAIRFEKISTGRRKIIENKLTIKF